MNSKFLKLVWKTYREPYPVSRETIDELRILQGKLLKKVEKTIHNDRITGRAYLEITGKSMKYALKNIEPGIKKWWQKQQELGLDEIGAYNTRELFNVVSDTWEYLKEFHNNYYPQENRNTKQQYPAKTSPAKPPESETTAAKITQLLKPIEGAFYGDKQHIETIAAGLLDYVNNRVCNVPIYRQRVIIDKATFYKPFVDICKETGLTPANIGEVLTRFIYQHNNSGKEIAQSTIRGIIYGYGRKLTNRNRP